LAQPFLAGGEPRLEPLDEIFLLRIEEERHPRGLIRQAGSAGVERPAVRVDEVDRVAPAPLLLDALEPLALGGVALHLEAVEVALALFGRQHEVGSDRQRRRCARGYGGGLLPGSTAAAPRRDRDRDV